MLEGYQILGMAKAYSDTELVKQSRRGVYANPEHFWTNGFMGFFEPVPDKVKDKAWVVLPVPDDFIPGLLADVAKRDIALVPVEVRPQARSDRVIVRFVDANKRMTGWIDARYVSAVISRHKENVRQKKHKRSKQDGKFDILTTPDVPLTWKAFDGGVVAFVGADPVAVIMALKLEARDLETPDWCLKCED